jgi:hypothetical protein
VVVSRIVSSSSTYGSFRPRSPAGSAELWFARRVEYQGIWLMWAVAVFRRLVVNGITADRARK